MAFGGLAEALPAVTIGAGPLLLLLALTLPERRRSVALLVATPVVWVAALALRTLLGGEPRSFYFLRNQLPMPLG